MPPAARISCDNLLRQAGVVAAAIDRGPEIVDDHLRALLGHQMRNGPADPSAGTGHHNDFVFHDPIRICHAFILWRVSTGASRCAAEDGLVQRYRSA